MLKQRIITAVILAPLMIWAILGLSDQYFPLLVGAIFLAAGWEWTSLSELANNVARLFYLLLLAVLMFFMANVVSANGPFVPLLLTLAVICWLIVFFWIFRQETGHKKLSLSTHSRLLIGLVLLLMPFIALVSLGTAFDNGRYLIIFLMFVIWGADVAAYFSGRAFGQRKLAPSISPGKTWEGVTGALLFTLLVAMTGVFLLGYGNAAYLYITVLSMIVVVFSIVGDLFESMIKRQAGMKDSGNLLPGHGGMLDRIDSLTAAAPIFAAGMYLSRTVL